MLLAQARCCHFPSQLEGWWKGKVFDTRKWCMKAGWDLTDHFWEGLLRVNTLRYTSRTDHQNKKITVSTWSLVNCLRARIIWTAGKSSSECQRQQQLGLRLDQSHKIMHIHFMRNYVSHKEDWALKNRCFPIAVLEKTLENPLEFNNIKPVNPKGNQHWIFIGSPVLQLEVQFFGHLMWTANSLEKILILGKIEGRRRGQQRNKWLDNITSSMDMSLSNSKR